MKGAYFMFSASNSAQYGRKVNVAVSGMKSICMTETAISRLVQFSLVVRTTVVMSSWHRDCCPVPVNPCNMGLDAGACGSQFPTIFLVSSSAGPIKNQATGPVWLLGRLFFQQSD